MKKTRKFCVDNVVSTNDLKENESILKKLWDYMTLEQREVWGKCKQVICGPFGSGKTILIQYKVAELASSDEEVMVIVPHHLMPGYDEFFKQMSNIELCSVEQFSKILKITKRKQTANMFLLMSYFGHIMYIWPYVH